MYRFFDNPFREFGSERSTFFSLFDENEIAYELLNPRLDALNPGISSYTSALVFTSSSNTGDDYADDTSTTGVLEVGCTATGVIDFDYDSDWFAIELTAGDVVKISTVGTEFGLFIRDAFGNIFLYGSTDYTANETSVFAQVTESGTYYLDIESYVSSLTYTLTATLVEDDFTGDSSTTGMLEVGGSATGTIDFRWDSDWFAIELSAGEITRLSVGISDVSLSLRDQEGNYLAYDFRDRETDETALIAQVDETGIYYVDISASGSPIDYTVTATAVEDDFAGDSTTSGILEVGTPVAGALDFQGDSDWFAIELTAGEVVRISTEATNVDLVLRDNLGNSLAYDYRDYALDENVLIASVNVSGTYYVDASSFFSNDEYTLTASELEDDFANGPSTSGTLTIDGSAMGSIEFRGDSDWFAIELTAGDVIRVVIDDYDADLLLRDLSGNDIASSYIDFDAGENVVVAEVRESGTYFVDVTYFGESLDYTLSASLIDDDFAGSAMTTGVLEVGSTATGRIDYRNDSDWFAITLTAGEVVRIAMPGTDASIILRDELGNFVASDFINFSPDERVIIAQVEESGTYYIDVNYFLSSLNYSLSATVIDDDFEGNVNTIGTLEIDNTVTGTIDFRNDRDWFAIELTAGEIIRIATENFNVDLVLRDALGNSIASDFIDSESNESVLIADVTETGTYYVDVGGFRSLEDYTLTASIQEDDYSNNPANPGVLEIGGEVSGVIDFANDEDWFALAITEADLDVRLFVDDPRINLSVFDENGSSFEASADNRSINFSETGMYFIAVSSSYGVGYDYNVSSIVVDSVGESLPISAAGIVGTVIDGSTDTTYSLTSDGVVIRYSGQEQTLLSDIDLGVDASALSLSQDGQYLFAAQADLTDIGNGVFEATVLRINTDTLDVETFSFEVTGRGYNITDIQTAADGSLFVTTNFPGSGWVPFYNLSGFDGDFSAQIIADPNFLIPDEVRQDTTLDISRDGQYLLIAESNISSYPVHIFSVADGEVIASTDRDGFNSDRNAISGEAGLVVAAGIVYDFNFNQVADLSYIFGTSGVAPVFSQNGDYLFLAHHDSYSGTSSISVVSTSSFEIVSFVDLDPSRLPILEIDLCSNGLALLVTDMEGVHRIDFSDSLLSIDGTPGNDRFFGTEFDESFDGGAGDDFVVGGSGDDSLFGGDGNDSIVGQAGDDTLTGGAGDDRLYSGPGDDVVDGGTGRDNILGGSGYDVLNGGDGNDTIDGQGHDDIINGGAGRDVIYGGHGNDLIRGDSGNDVLRSEDGNDRIEGGNGNDYLGGAAGNDLLIGGAGHDRLYGGSGQDRLFGQQGDDLLHGGGGDDILVAAAGNDTLFGDNGDDLLFGGSTNDTLTGGTGADTFVLSQFAGITTVTDFTDGEDLLDFSNFSDVDIQSALDEAVQEDGSVVLTFANGAVLVLENFDLSNLSEDDITGYDGVEAALII